MMEDVSVGESRFSARTVRRVRYTIWRFLGIFRPIETREIELSISMKQNGSQMHVAVNGTPR